MMDAENREEYKPGNNPDTGPTGTGRTEEGKTTANMAWIDYVAMLEELEYK